MHSRLSASSYNLFSKIFKIFGTTDKYLSGLNFSFFLSETHNYIGLYLCDYDLRAGDWSQQNWYHFSLPMTAIGRTCVPNMSNKPIKTAGCTFSGSIL